MAHAGWSTQRAPSAVGGIGLIAVGVPGVGLASHLIFVLYVFLTMSRFVSTMYPANALLFPAGAGDVELVQYMSAADHARVMTSIFNANHVDMLSPMPTTVVSAGRRGASLSGLRCSAALASARPLTQGLVKPSTEVVMAVMILLIDFRRHIHDSSMVTVFMQELSPPPPMLLLTLGLVSCMTSGTMAWSDLMPIATVAVWVTLSLPPQRSRGSMVLAPTMNRTMRQLEPRIVSHLGRPPATALLGEVSRDSSRSRTPRL